MSGAAICRMAFEGKKAEFIAAVNNDTRVLTTKDEDDRQPLHWACSGSHPEIVEFILAQQPPVDVNAADDSGWTPLHIAASVGNEGIVRQLLVKHANPTNTTDSKQTPLHYAASKNHLPVSKLLLEHGADANARDNTGASPLHRAAIKGHTAMCKALIAGGASVNALDRTKSTALHLAVSEEHGELAVELITAHRADASVRNVDEQSALDLASARIRALLLPHLQDGNP